MYHINSIFLWKEKLRRKFDHAEEENIRTKAAKLVFFHLFYANNSNSVNFQCEVTFTSWLSYDIRDLK